MSLMVAGLMQQEGYRAPRESILSAALTPWYQNVSIASVSPDGSKLLSLEKEGMVSIATLARPFLNLAGLQIDEKAARERPLSTQSVRNFRITEISTGKSVSSPLLLDS